MGIGFIFVNDDFLERAYKTTRLLQSLCFFSSSAVVRYSVRRPPPSTRRDLSVAGFGTDDFNLRNICLTFVGL